MAGTLGDEELDAFDPADGTGDLADEAVAGVGACFRPAGVFSAAAVRSEGSGAGAVCAAFESGVGEVSSGKAVLHIRSLETKKFSLAGR